MKAKSLTTDRGSYKLLLSVIVIFLSTVVLYSKTILNIQKITTIHGVAPGDGFGSPVQNLGDINNDGYPDLAIGYQYYPYSPSTKRIDIYYGGATLDTIPDLTFWRPLNIHGNMDLNGDGYIDLAAYYYTSFDIGMVKIFFGSIDGPDTTADIILYGEWYYDKFGSQMASGDLNNDGYDDLIISSPHDDYAAYGRVYVYLGGNPMDTEPDWFYQSPEEFAQYGESLVCGDLNADGYDDFLVGAPYDLARKPGKIYIYSGGDTLTTTAARIIEAPDSLSYLGRKMVYVSDWNGSQYGMILAGWIITEGYRTDVLKISGSSEFDSLKTEIIYNLYNSSDQYFFYGFLQGYINDDYVKDIAIGANNSDLYFYLGPSDFSSPDSIFDNTNYGLGRTIDINNDGIDEIIGKRSIITDSTNSAKSYLIDFYSCKPLPVSNILKGKLNSHPDCFILESIYPNPFNNSTTIHIYLSKSEKVYFTIYDLMGREIWKSTRTSYPAGTHSLVWNGTNKSGQPVGTGVYLVRLNSPKYSATQKVLLIK